MMGIRVWKIQHINLMQAFLFSSRSAQAKHASDSERKGAFSEQDLDLDVCMHYLTLDEDLQHIFLSQARIQMLRLQIATFSCFSLHFQRFLAYTMQDLG